MEVALDLDDAFESLHAVVLGARSILETSTGPGSVPTEITIRAVLELLGRASLIAVELVHATRDSVAMLDEGEAPHVVEDEPRTVPGQKAIPSGIVAPRRRLPPDAPDLAVRVPQEARPPRKL